LQEAGLVAEGGAAVAVGEGKGVSPPGVVGSVALGLAGGSCVQATVGVGLVGLGVRDAVRRGVRVAVRVGGRGVRVGVRVRDGAKVLVGSGVDVEVGVAVAVEVKVGVALAVSEAVAVGVGVSVGVSVAVADGVAVSVGGEGVSVGVPGASGGVSPGEVGEGKNAAVRGSAGAISPKSIAMPWSVRRSTGGSKPPNAASATITRAVKLNTQAPIARLPPRSIVFCQDVLDGRRATVRVLRLTPRPPATRGFASPIIRAGCRPRP
jgi:hypothetical protein